MHTERPGGEAAFKNGKEEGVTPKEYLEIETVFTEIIKAAESGIYKTHEDALLCPLPELLRPATARDITVGRVVWYRHGDRGHFWKIVGDVLRPEDPWKAYTAEDGCRYGLDDAWVEGATP